MRRNLADRTKALAAQALPCEGDPPEAQWHQTRALGTHLLASTRHLLLAA